MNRLLRVKYFLARLRRGRSVILPGSWVTDLDAATDVILPAPRLLPVATQSGAFPVQPGYVLWSPLNQRYELVTFVGTRAYFDDVTSQWVAR